MKTWILPFCWIIFAIFVNFYHILNRLTQQRVEEGDRIRKLSPKERLKLLKETLKKSTTLTEKLLRRLDKKWDNIYKEDSEDGKSFFLFLSSNGLFLRDTFRSFVFVFLSIYFIVKFKNVKESCFILLENLFYVIHNFLEISYNLLSAQKISWKRIVAQFLT